MFDVFDIMMVIMATCIRWNYMKKGNLGYFSFVHLRKCSKLVHFLVDALQLVHLEH